MKWTEAFVHKLMNQHKFIGVDPSATDEEIAVKLYKIEYELAYHNGNEVLRAIKSWIQNDT